MYDNGAQEEGGKNNGNCHLKQALSVVHTMTAGLLSDVQLIGILCITTYIAYSDNEL